MQVNMNLRLEGGDIGKGTEGKDFSTTLFHRMITAPYFVTPQNSFKIYNLAFNYTVIPALKLFKSEVR